MDTGILGDEDFVFYKKENGEFVGGGFKIDSFFLNNGISPMTTQNEDGDSDVDKQEGGNMLGGNLLGGNLLGGKVSSPFENLAVPAGLFYVNLRVPKNRDLDKKKEEHFYKMHDHLSDEIFDKLYALVDANNKPKRKTRRHLIKQTNKTRKQKVI